MTANNQDNHAADPDMDATALYREEVITDRKVGTLRSLTPIKIDGSTDLSRPVIYVGQAQILTPMGALPLSFEVNATNLKDAVAKFGDAAKIAIDQAVQELREMRRDAASSIIIPDGPGSAGGLPPGRAGGKLGRP